MLPNVLIVFDILLQIGIVIGPAGILASSIIKTFAYTGLVRLISILITLASFVWLATMLYWYISFYLDCCEWYLPVPDIIAILVGYLGLLALWLFGQFVFFAKKSQTRVDLFAFFGVLISVVSLIVMFLLAIRNI